MKKRLDTQWPRPRGCSGGFTLIELMVVIGVIGLLAGLLLPVLGRAKDKGRQAACKANLKQIGLAFQMYHGDFRDQFPAPGSVQRYGPQPEDWIWWQYGRGVSNSVIAAYLDGFNPRIFTCPSDREGQDMQHQGILPNEPYRYSYSLTSYDLDNGRNKGMATIITPQREVFPFFHTQIQRPSFKIMLVEEDRETMDDPRWVPHGSQPNLVSPRHGGLGNVMFADGHVEHVSPVFGLNPTNSLPGL